MPAQITVAGFPLALSSTQDLALGEDGDLLIGPDGDLERVSGADALLQTVLFRLRTRIGDAYYAPDCGASLDALIGLPLSEATGSQAEAQVTRALTHDGLFDAEEITYITAPTADGSGIQMYISLDLSGFADVAAETLSFAITISLQEGLLV